MICTFPDSARAMASILDLHFETGSIVDLNWGHGVFYKSVPERAVVGVDIRRTGHVVADNGALPFKADAFDIAVVDPPYKRGRGNSRYTERYGDAPCTEARVDDMYRRALCEAVRVAEHGAIVKLQDSTDGHAFVNRKNTIENFMISKFSIRVHDLALVVRSNMPNSCIHGKRHFFARNVSYFLIYKWRKKRGKLFAVRY